MGEIKIHSSAEASQPSPKDGGWTLHAPKLCFVGSSHLITKFEGGRKRRQTERGRGEEGGRAVKNAQPCHPPLPPPRGYCDGNTHTRMDTNGGE